MMRFTRRGSETTTTRQDQRKSSSLSNIDSKPYALECKCFASREQERKGASRTQRTHRRGNPIAVRSPDAASFLTPCLHRKGRAAGTTARGHWPSSAAVWFLGFPTGAPACPSLP